ncbi:MAG: hypothetical protein FWC00_03360 [Firmicutes bacterium]|nr:hypothetical protein [Bacillota bacterium]
MGVYPYNPNCGCTETERRKAKRANIKKNILFFIGMMLVSIAFVFLGYSRAWESIEFIGTNLFELLILIHALIILLIVVWMLFNGVFVVPFKTKRYLKKCCNLREKVETYVKSYLSYLVYSFTVILALLHGVGMIFLVFPIEGVDIRMLILSIILIDVGLAFCHIIHNVNDTVTIKKTKQKIEVMSYGKRFSLTIFVNTVIIAIVVYIFLTQIGWNEIINLNNLEQADGWVAIALPYINRFSYIIISFSIAFWKFFKRFRFFLKHIIAMIKVLSTRKTEANSVMCEECGCIFKQTPPKQ